MKKSHAKRKTFVAKAIVFLLTVLTVVIIHSCRKDSKQQKQSGPNVTLINNNINLSMLKNAYKVGISKNSLKVSDVNQSVVNLIASLNVDWTSYVLSTYPDSTQVIEFSIPNDTALVVPGALATNNSIKYHTKTSAVFILRQDTINMSFFMKTVEDCTTPGYLSVISNVFYNNQPSTFNGNVFYFTLGRQYINGYQWQNGAVSKALSIGSSSTSSQQTSSKPSTYQQIHSKKTNRPITNEVQLTNCVTDVYEVYNVTVDQQGNILSWQNQVGTIYVTTCDVVDTGEGSSGGTSTTTSGGAGGGGVNGAAPLPKPCPGGSGTAVSSVKGKLVVDVTSGGSSGGSTSSPCAVVVSTPSTPIFGVNNSNAQIPDANFDAFLSYAQSLGLSISNPFDVVLTVNGKNYTGQMTEVYNSAGEVIAAYFSPDATSGPFQTGMEYSIGSEQDNTSTQSSGDVSYNGLDFGNTSTNIGTSTVSYTHTTIGGSTVPTTITSNEIADAIYVSDGRAAINPQQYINCFTDGKTASGYKMTIYVAQPAPGTNAEWSSIIPVPPLVGMVFTLPGGQLLNVGHTFICFEKDNTDGSSVKQVMGFYPSGNGVNSKGIIKDDSGHPYNESYSMSVSVPQFNAALAKLQSDNTNAHYVVSKAIGSEYNCTDAAISWFDTAGGDFPAVSRGYFVNSPGDFGYALMDVKGATTVSGKAPQSHGPCTAN